MRPLAILLCAITLFTGCGQEADPHQGPPPIHIMTAEEHAAEERQRLEAVRRYEAALARSPVYRSDIRDTLIEHP